MADARRSDALTIDELARITGMSSRNIRAHQSRGLLPPPDVRGRTGYYTPDHVARLELVQALQADGFSLESIRRLLERAGGSTDAVRRLVGTARAGFGDEAPEVLAPEELAARWGLPDPGWLTHAIALGVLRPRDDGRLEVPPSVARAGRELAGLDVAPERVLAVLVELRDGAETIAHAFVRLFVEEVWSPFDAAGRPPERLATVQDALARLGPLATDSLVAVFRQEMRAAIDGLAAGELTPAGADAADGAAARI